MNIDTVSDVFAFTCRHPEYWDLLHGEEDIPELDTEERKVAFAAAREHVLESVEGLLVTCLRRFQAVVPTQEHGRYGYLPRQNVQSAKTRKNRYVRTMILEGAGKESWLWISLERDWSGQGIHLFATVSSKRENIRAFANARPAAPPETNVEGNDYYFGNLPMEQGARFTGLADRLVEAAWPGVVQFVDLLSPRRF